MPLPEAACNIQREKAVLEAYKVIESIEIYPDGR